jgi:prepilin-type processing-associated H-X9-DG protein
MWKIARRRRGEAKAPVVLIVVVVIGALALFLVVVIGILAAMLLPAVARARGEARRIRCRNNLNQVAKGMATYLNEHGDNRFYPCPLNRGAEPNNYNGAEWLASLYWTYVVPDPGVFLCPSSGDTNHNGLDLGTERAAQGRFGSQTVSYAGMHYHSLTDAAGQPIPGAIRDDFPPNMPMASDDTQGTINHGSRSNGGMGILFFDSHVEFATNTEVDLERAVGRKPGLLWQLRN